MVPTLYKLRLFADEATMQDILTFVCKELRAHLHFRLLLLLIFFFERKEAAIGNNGAFEGHILHLNICE